MKSASEAAAAKIRANAVRLLSLKEVSARTSLSKASINRMRVARQFPAALRLSQGRVAWRDEDIDRWIDRLRPAKREGAE